MFREKAIRLVVNQPCRILNETETFDVDGNIIEYNENEVLEKMAELQADYDAKQYQRDRLSEYPSIQECIHAILDDELEALQLKRSAVKAKYPKPE